MPLPFAVDVLQMQLFDDNNNHPLQLDAFQRICLEICKVPFDNTQQQQQQQIKELANALLVVSATYHKQLRFHLQSRKQHCHVLIWFTIGRLFALQAQEPIDWGDSILASFTGNNEVPCQARWSDLQCRIVTHALSLYFQIESPITLLNPLWWRGIENLHGRLVTILGPLIGSQALADVAGVLDIYAIFMDCYYVRHGLTVWLTVNSESRAIPRTIGTSRDFVNLTRGCESWILREANASSDNEIPPQVIQTLHEQAVRVGDDSLYFRANNLTRHEINPQFCLEICRTQAAFLWWFQEERYLPVREQLQTLQPGLTPRMRAILALYVFDRWFVLRYGVSWLSIACRDETALINNTGKNTPSCAVQLCFCGSGFFVYYQQQAGLAPTVLLCDNVFAALVLWLHLTCRVLAHAAEVNYQGRLYRFEGLGELLLDWTTT